MNTVCPLVIEAVVRYTHWYEQNMKILSVIIVHLETADLENDFSDFFLEIFQQPQINYSARYTTVTEQNIHVNICLHSEMQTHPTHCRHYFNVVMRTHTCTHAASGYTSVWRKAGKVRDSE